MTPRTTSRDATEENCEVVTLNTPRKKPRRKKKQKKLGIEAIVEPGVGASYVRGTWMMKPNELGKQKRRKPRKGSKNG